ncbi:MAG TPA: GNAT family N-acetyltransferase [Solirubrobacteraceae bacterium]
MPKLAVRPMGTPDAAAVRAIGAAADERFRLIDDPRIAACADHSPITIEELVAYIDAGRAWVATQDGALVGFVVVDTLDGGAHIEELSVAPSAQRRGHGARLLEMAARWAQTAGFGVVTLTTFRDVPWNAPWYESRGFRVVAPGEITPELGGRRDEEDARGLPAELRVVMCRDVGPR